MITIEIKPDVARTMNRAAYKEARRWCRVTSKLVEAEMKKNQEAIDQSFKDLAYYGTASFGTTTVSIKHAP